MFSKFLNRRQSRTWIILPLIALIFALPLFGQSTRTYRYDVDLTVVKGDKFKVVLDASDFAAPTAIYHFPMMIPGTYRVADYGKYIKKFVARDEAGHKLKIKKTDKNTFVISGAENLREISYWVADTWDAKFVKDDVYPMAGTNIDAGRNFSFTNSNVFGYFEGELMNPIEARFKVPSNLYGITVLPQEKLADGRVLFTAENYHKLVDAPIMFAEPDTALLYVGGTRVLIGVDHETRSDPLAGKLKNALAPSMEAIGEFLNPLPIDNYSFIIYFADAHQLGKLVDNPRFAIPKLLWYVLLHGLPSGGALEHNTSSFYYLPDIGPSHFNLMEETMADIAIHEFMHIVTPLTLHSELVGDFDYADPKMSQHLWLYEGVTEYFSGIIRARGGIFTPKEYLQIHLRGKILNGERFPYEEMSFTELSKGALEKKYKKQYGQVYQRGAILGALLDLEIIRLTNGEKTLIDVLMELSADFGIEKSFSEDTFFDDFTAKVHPDLRDFFTKYIEGREALPYTEFFDIVGVEYRAKITEQRPMHPIKDNAVKTPSLSIGDYYTILKVKKGESFGLQKNDRVRKDSYSKLFSDENGAWLPEGTEIEIPIIRDGKAFMLPHTIKYIEAESTGKFRIRNDMTADQQRLYKIWLGLD